MKRRRPRITIEGIDAESITRYLKACASFRSKATVYGTLSTMRGFGDYLVRQGLWKINPLRWMKGPAHYDTIHFYAKALRWIGADRLLVGVVVRTLGPPMLPKAGNKIRFLGYLIGVPRKKVLRELDETQVLSQYGIDSRKQGFPL